MGDLLSSFPAQQYVQKCVPSPVHARGHLPPNLVPTTQEGSWGPELERVRTPGLQARDLRCVNRVSQG